MSSLSTHSYTGKALIWGLNSNFFLPKNEKQSFLNATLGKSWRAVSRYAYCTVVQIFVSLPGAALHFSHAGMYGFHALLKKEKSDELQARSWKHISAGTLDLGAFIYVLCNLIFPIFGNLSALFYAVNPVIATSRYLHPYERKDHCILYFIKNIKGNKIEKIQYEAFKIQLNKIFSFFSIKNQLEMRNTFPCSYLKDLREAFKLQYICKNKFLSAG